MSWLADLFATRDPGAATERAMSRNLTPASQTAIQRALQDDLLSMSGGLSNVGASPERMRTLLYLLQRMRSGAGGDRQVAQTRDGAGIGSISLR